MADRRLRAGTGQGVASWPVLMLLLLAVLVPTACVLWFMNEAMRNERLAVRQKLEDAYRLNIEIAAGALAEFPNALALVLADMANLDEEPSILFGLLLEDEWADSLVIYDASGRVRYPDRPRPLATSKPAPSPQWQEARRLELNGNDPVGAARAYAAVAEKAKDVNAAAEALRAQARCLAKAGELGRAIEILTKVLPDERYRHATDSQGRVISLNAQLRALQLMENSTHPGFRKVVDGLAARLTNYDDMIMPASQRRFLMRELQRLRPESHLGPMLLAEDLADRYLQVAESVPPPSTLTPSPLPKVWQLTASDQTIVLLFTESRLVSHLESIVGRAWPVSGAALKILTPDGDRPEAEPLLSMSGPAFLPGWELALYLPGPDPFAAAADRQITAYLWTGSLVIVIMSMLALLIARHVTRQMKLTRLKNDLIATVSHELKTPLASMRVLADTLLAGHTRDEQQSREYVRLIAKENARLSRLIDNFLTFSRMERNKRSFEFADVNVEEVVGAAVDAVRDRFDSPACRLDVEVAPGLPTITGDHDALVTVLINLLDNAYKYTEDHKHIVVRAYASQEDGTVCLAVSDNGIGLSWRAVKRVFDRFYQVDQRLTRGAGGCGLGLSIVEFIVAAHGGSIDVSSEPGRGSTFTVKLPGAGKASDDDA